MLEKALIRFILNRSNPRSFLWKRKITLFLYLRGIPIPDAAEYTLLMSISAVNLQCVLLPD